MLESTKFSKKVAGTWAQIQAKSTKYHLGLPYQYVAVLVFSVNGRNSLNARLILHIVSMI
jgi:hypothetical protein